LSQGMDQPTPEEQRLADAGRDTIAAAVAATRAPQQLRERLEADRADRRRTPRRRGLLAPVATVLALAAVAVLALTLRSDDGTIGGGGRAGGPTVLALAALAGRPIVQPAPRPDPAHPGTLDASVDRVAFPEYGGRLRWRASGARSDRVFGAPARTVHYHGPNGTMAAYTIVAGTRLAQAPGARTVRFAGTDYRVADSGGRTVVTWERDGHTCVLSGPTSVGRQALLSLAWWRA
jgi:hypothetical protein